MTNARLIAAMFLAPVLVLPTAVRADTVDFKIDLIGQGLQVEPNYEAELLFSRSPTPEAYSQNSFILSSQQITVISDTIPFAPSIFPLLFSPGEISLDDSNVGAPANESTYNLGFNGKYFPQASPNFFTGTNAAPNFVNGTYLGFGFLGAGYIDHLTISSVPDTTPTTPTPEPWSIIFVMTGLSIAGCSLVRRSFKNPLSAR